MEVGERSRQQEIERLTEEMVECFHSLKLLGTPYEERRKLFDQVVKDLDPEAKREITDVQYRNR